MAIQRLPIECLPDAIEKFVDDAKNCKIYREVIEIKFARGNVLSVKSLIKKRRLAEYMEFDKVYFDLNPVEEDEENFKNLE